MTRNKKRILFAALIGCAIILIPLSLCCVACRITDEAGGCIAVVFDKQDVKNADRIVLRDGDTVITLAEPTLVRDLASEFVVANRSGLCGYYRDRWMEIYRGDRLVRNIHWNDHDDLVTAYEADAGHWVLFGGDKGQIQLSDEIVDTINALIESAK